VASRTLNVCDATSLTRGRRPFSPAGPRARGPRCGRRRA
jgi:hypothetical protein